MNISFAPKGRSHQRSLSLLLVFAFSLAFSFLSLTGCNSHSSHSSHTQQTNQSAAAAPTPRIPAYFAQAEQAKPLPAVLDPRQFSDPVIVKAYGFAKDLPEVFAQQPCYCYCDDGFGHRSLLDCYATDHSAG